MAGIPEAILMQNERNAIMGGPSGEPEDGRHVAAAPTTHTPGKRVL